VLRRKPILQLFAAALVLAGALGTASAADLTKKWRVSLSAGGANSNDEVESASANEMITLNTCIRTATCTSTDENVLRAFRDPRSDSSVFGSLDINPGSIATLGVQYGVNKFFVVEGSVGYQKSDLGDVELSAELPGNGPIDPSLFPFNFVTRRIPVGEMELVPIQLTGIMRFRPRATFNPYFGVGLGYTIVGFDTDPAFDQLSLDMDASRGAQMRLEPFFVQGSAGGETLSPEGPQLDLSGATIDARDTFEWHLVAGTELTFKKRWTAFVDLRWIDASRSVSVGFNGAQELGRSVPSFAPFNDDPMANVSYGAVDVGSCGKDPDGVDQNGNAVNCQGGGLYDFGYVVVVPRAEAPIGTNCSDPNDIAGADCVLDFVFEPDGVPDPGRYYAQGGSVDYDQFALQLGIRFTFGK